MGYKSQHLQVHSIYEILDVLEFVRDSESWSRKDAVVSPLHWSWLSRLVQDHPFCSQFSITPRLDFLQYLCAPFSHSSWAHSEANSREILCRGWGESMTIHTHVCDAHWKPLIWLIVYLLDFHGWHLSGPTSLQCREASSQIYQRLHHIYRINSHP